MAKTIENNTITFKYLDDYKDISTSLSRFLENQGVYMIHDANGIGDTDIINIFENKEEKEMKNEVLKLWYDRKRKNIDEKYDTLQEKFVNDKYSVVASFKDLVEKFNNDLDELYKYDKVTEQFVLNENNGCNVIKYRIDYDKLEQEFKEKYESEREKELEKLRETVNEISALLSMSSDLEYQQNVLIEYGIIDKKTKRMIFDEDSSK